MNKRQNELHLLNIERVGLSTVLPNSAIKMRVCFDYNGIVYRKPIINNPRSPYKAIDSLIYYQKDILGVRINHLADDTPEPYYFRSPYILVVNSTFLSPCGQGCLFCEQTQARTEKRRYSLRFHPHQLFDQVLKENNMKDFSRLKQISIITSCAGSEGNAIRLLSEYIKAADKRKFRGKFLFASHEIRSQAGLEKLSQMGDIILAFTVECFSKRGFFMPGSKGQISLEQIRVILEQANRMGVASTYFYIFGLDNLAEIKKGFVYLSKVLSYAPTYSIYYHQACEKNKIVPLRPLKYYLSVRKIYNEAHKDLQKFESCQSFRSLWPLENNKSITLIQ